MLVRIVLHAWSGRSQFHRPIHRFFRSGRPAGRPYTIHRAGNLEEPGEPGGTWGEPGHPLFYFFLALSLGSQLEMLKGVNHGIAAQQIRQRWGRGRLSLLQPVCPPGLPVRIRSSLPAGISLTVKHGWSKGCAFCPPSSPSMSVPSRSWSTTTISSCACVLIS